jgi:hypothetical protein
LKLKTINKMNIKDRLLLIAASFALGWLLVDATTMSISSATLNSTLVIDTIKPVKPQDIVLDVKGKNVLFIGDSHTAADYGWQYQLCKKTQMKYFNTAVGGKQTAWMLEVAKLHVNSGYDYCFIYGGANDMAGNRAPIKSVHNIQKIVNLCLEKQVTPIVLTGFDPLTCVVVGSRESYKMYPSRYAKFQQLLVDSIKGAIVLKTHCISRTDCGDFLCHMTASGHKKMTSFIISACKFKTY